ncbi:tetratricopeptide repeat protein [Actinosynnema sp. CA-299493]
MSDAEPSVPEHGPTRVRFADVVELGELTRRLRARDYRHGGVGPRDEAVAALPVALAMLGVPVAERLVGPLHTAVADLHALAGWASFDIGLVDAARHCFRTALRVSAAVGNASLTSNVYYRLGRVRLHHDDPVGALAEFGLAEPHARASGSARAMALVKANQAWAKARLGEEDAVLALLAAAEGRFAASGGEAVPGWMAFFTATDLSSLVGVVYTELAQRVDPQYAGLAVPKLTAAAEGFGPDMARSRAFSLMSLATCHLLEDRVDLAAVVGHQALDLCSRLVSTRTVERLRPLRNEAERRRSHPTARDLAERIRTFRTIPRHSE